MQRVRRAIRALEWERGESHQLTPRGALLTGQETVRVCLEYSRCGLGGFSQFLRQTKAGSAHCGLFKAYLTQHNAQVWRMRQEPARRIALGVTG